MSSVLSMPHLEKPFEQRRDLQVMLPALHIVQFTRRPAPGAYSIERVDGDIRSAFPPQLSLTVAQNRFLSRGLVPRLKDAWRARRFKADVYHVTGDVHFLTFFLPKARTVLTIHDTVLVERAGGFKRLLLWLLWYWLPEKRCAAIVTISEESKRRILSLLHCDPAKITVIHNPVSPELRKVAYREPKGAFKFLHIGTKTNKNLERVVAAVAGLDAELTIVGKLQPHQRKLLESSRVRYHNFVDLSDSELRAAYAETHALIFASTDEGFGLPIVEAQALGRPVITSARAPMDEVAGAGALLVDPEDVGSIASACRMLMADGRLRARLIAAGLENVERFRPEAAAQAYARLFVKLVEGVN